MSKNSESLGTSSAIAVISPTKLANEDAIKNVMVDLDLLFSTDTTIKKNPCSLKKDSSFDTNASLKKSSRSLKKYASFGANESVKKNPCALKKYSSFGTNASAKENPCTLKKDSSFTENSFGVVVERDVERFVDARDAEDTTPLPLAATRGHHSVVEGLLKTAATVDGWISQGNAARAGFTLLHCAVEDGDRDVVRLLLVSGAPVNAGTAAGTTALDIAVWNGNPEIAVDLLIHGADINSVCNFAAEGSIPPLHLTTEPDDSDVSELTRLLLKHGAQVVDATGRSKITLQFPRDVNRSLIVTYVFLARLLRHEKSARLLDAVDTRPEYGEIVEDFRRSNPTIFYHVVCRTSGNVGAPIRLILHSATEKGYSGVVEDFLQWPGIDDFLEENEQFGGSYTLLHAAAKHRRHEVAEVLIKHGANVEAKYKVHRTPFFYAFRNQDARMTRILLGARGWTPSVELFNAAVKVGVAEIIDIFLENRPSFDINAINNCGDTALHYIAAFRQESAKEKARIARLLLARGADPNLRNRRGLTPLHVAAQEGDASLVLEIVAINDREMGETASDLLSSASGNSSATIFRRTVKINARSPYGMTALHLASGMDRWEVVEVLLTFGADLSAKTWQGKTATDLAFEGCFKETFRSLEARGAHVTMREITCNSSFVDDVGPDILLARYKRSIISNFFVPMKRFHAIRMTAAGLDFFEPEELPIPTKQCEGDLRAWRKNCEEEVAKMKKMVTKVVSFYDVLTGSTHKAARLSRNPHAVRALATEDLATTFPIYYKMIQYNIRRGQQREKLMNVALESFDRQFSLPTEILVENIFRYLSDDDLENLIEAKHGCALFR